MMSDVSQRQFNVIDQFLLTEYLLSVFDNDGGETVKPGALDMFRVDLSGVIEHMLKSNYDLTTSQDKINGKLFLFAQTLWLKTHRNRLNGVKTVFESDNNRYSISKRKAYTITKLPKYVTLNLEYGEYFDYTDAGTESGENDFKRNVCYILPNKFDLSE
jgi:hypothetical protein